MAPNNQLTEAESKAAQAELEAGNHDGGPQDNWTYQTRAYLDDPANEPTLRSGVDIAKLIKWRRVILMFISKAGGKLKLHHFPIAAAVILCARFYTRRSMQNNDKYVMATACLHLAAKMEENVIPLREMIRTCYHLKAGNSTPGRDPKAQAAELAAFQENVLLAERSVLYTLGFELQLKSPYHYLTSHAQQLGLIRPPDDSNYNPHFRYFWQNVWNFTNDSFRTTLCLQYPPKQTAAAAFYLANIINMHLHQDARDPHGTKGDVMQLVYQQTNDPNVTFFTYFDVTEKQLEDMCDQILSVYEEKYGPYVPARA